MTLYELESVEEWGNPSPAGWVLVRAYARPASIDYYAAWKLHDESRMPLISGAQCDDELAAVKLLVDAALGGNDE